ncbi:MAG: hypothetical protein JWQ12_1756 [Glaciihabitans sp.]|nr:hypothetical protein [Glaciihabitans sp.]
MSNSVMADSDLTPAAVRSMFRRAGVETDLTIDLSVVRYVDHVALALILSSIAARKSHNLSTKLIAPRSPRVLDYLQTWHFFEHMSDWVGDSLINLLDHDSAARLEQRRVDKHRSVYDEFPAGQPPEDPYADLEQSGPQMMGLPESPYFPRNHFPISRVDIEKGGQLHAAARERDSWLDDPLQSLLARIIGPQAGKLVARTVVFEGIKNTGMHPNATAVFTSAQFVRDKVGAPREFVMCMWDNGSSVPETLRAGFETFGAITTPAFGQLKERFRVRVWDEGASLDESPKANFVMDTTEPPYTGDRLALLISAFFLGVTSIPGVRSDHELPSKEISDRVAALGGPGLEFYGGLGLYLIRDAVAYQAGGAVEYYNGVHHLTITSTGIPDEYDVDVEEALHGNIGIRGNLLIIRLPTLGAEPIASIRHVA